MASTDIDGNVIVILTKNEAREVFNRLIIVTGLTVTESKIIDKIIRDLRLICSIDEYGEYTYHELDKKIKQRGRKRCDLKN